MSFNRALGYLQRVSGPQILRESRRRIQDATEPKKMGNNFCVLELKPLILNNYYLNQLVLHFPMYCHILVHNSNYTNNLPYCAPLSCLKAGSQYVASRHHARHVARVE